MGDFDIDSFARQHEGLFRLREAELAGWDDSVRKRLIERGRIERVHDGVLRFRGAPDTWRSRALAAAWAGGDLCGVSHRSANKLYGLPGGAQRPIEIICRRWGRAHHKGLRVHEFSGLLESDLTVVARLPVVVPELAVLHIAGHRWATVDHVERAIYAARRQGWLTNSSLQEYLYRRARKGRPGVRKLREALGRSLMHARPTASETETMLLQTLRAHGLPEPELQFELRDDKGVLIATVDAALTKWQILLEYDSRQHHSDETDEDRDNRRREWAARYGYWLIPARYLDLQEGGHSLVAAIRGAIARLEGRVPAPRIGA